jgi:hypothetical protein
MSALSLLESAVPEIPRGAAPSEKMLLPSKSASSKKRLPLFSVIYSLRGPLTRRKKSRKAAQFEACSLGPFRGTLTLQARQPPEHEAHGKGAVGGRLARWSRLKFISIPRFRKRVIAGIFERGIPESKKLSLKDGQEQRPQEFWLCPNEQIRTECPRR